MNTKKTRLITDRIMPLPRSATAAAHVEIDGKHYCSFASMRDAEVAVAAWEKKWMAVKEKRLTVVYEGGPQECVA